MPSPIEPFYAQSLQVLGRFAGQDPSSEAWLRDTLGKTLVLVAVSYFDAELTAALDGAFRRYLADGVLLPLAVRSAVEMKFHSLFDWRSQNANRFLAFFGAPSPGRIRSALVEHGIGADAAFVEIGALRNRLAHRGFATYPVNKTLDELFELAQLAERFLQVVLAELARCGPGLPAA